LELANIDKPSRIVEKRLKQRHKYFYSRVYDETTHDQTGRLVDITTQGMRLKCDKPVEANTNFQFRMVLPVGIEGKRSITFDAKSMWCKKTVNSDLYDSGFRLTNISPGNIEIIEKLIREY